MNLCPATTCGNHNCFHGHFELFLDFFYSNYLTKPNNDLWAVISYVVSERKVIGLACVSAKYMTFTLFTEIADVLHLLSAPIGWLNNLLCFIYNKREYLQRSITFILSYLVTWECFRSCSPAQKTLRKGLRAPSIWLDNFLKLTHFRLHDNILDTFFKT